MSFAERFLQRCAEVVAGIDPIVLESAAHALASVRDAGGRLFIIGSGGGAGHASHAACDFRKLCNTEAYAPYDNVSELTARVNDDGWDSTISNWLEVSRLRRNDALLVFSVGGGSTQKQISMNLVNAMQLAEKRGATVVAIVGKDGGYAGEHADIAVIVPPVDGELITPLTEGFQAVIWHLLVSHPALQINTCKWESVSAPLEKQPQR